MNIWLVVINPNAGNRSGLKKWGKIKLLLKSRDINFVPLIIEEPGQTINKVKEAINKGFRKIMIVGGDGTLNEVVNAIFLSSHIPSKEFKIGIIPTGTGNDWCRTYKIPFNKFAHNVDVIKKEKTILQDVGIVKYCNNEKTDKRFFINNAGMGYDAMVVKKANNQKSRGCGNSLSYLLNVFTMLFSYKSQPIKVTVDQEELTTDMFSMNVGICRYMGAGMMLLPYAIPDDGLFEFTLIRKISKRRVILNYPKMYNGNIVKLRETYTTIAENILIESEEKVFLETDGEIIGHSPFEFSIMQKAIQIVVP